MVSFHSGETQSSVLNGFTIRGGAASYGGGIYVSNASPTIENDTVTANQACFGGAGIYLTGGAAVVFHDIVSGNKQEPSCSGGIGGAGLALSGVVGVEVTNTAVTGNTWGTGSGPGGVSIFGAGTVLLLDNTIQNNSPGGITIFNDNTATIAQNIITGNSGGPALNISSPATAQGPIVTNNTVVGGNNEPALVVSGFDSGVEFYNNIFVSGSVSQPAVNCSSNSSQTPPVFVTNLAWSGGPPAVAGTCVGSFMTQGNIIANPEFVQPSTGSYQLMAGSPAVNAGTNRAPGVQATDFIHNQRFVGGRIDLGVYELQ